MKPLHYVYRVTSLLENKHYYGLRSCNISPDSDLGIHYFTSSSDKSFKNDFKLNPQNYKCVIVKIFEKRKDAANYEILLHEKFNVDINEKFYNKVKAKQCGRDMKGFKHTKYSKAKMSKARIGKEPWNKGKTNCYNKETLKKMSNARIGKEPCNKGKKGMWKPTEANLINLSKAMKGRVLSQEHKDKLKKPKTNTLNYKYPKEKVKCPYCEKVGGKGSMHRWHFDNCKVKVKSTH